MPVTGDPQPAPDPAARELAAALQRMAVALDEERRTGWDRSLPLPELVTDRFARAERLGFGERASAYDSAVVLGDVSVGAQTWIGPGTLLDGSGSPLRIGAWVSVSAGVHIYTHDTLARSLTMGRASRRVGSVTIGDGTHLGAHVVVLAGVTIGSQCVVGAGSVVTRDVPDRAVAAGSPAVVIGCADVDGDEVRLRYGPVAVAEVAAPARPPATRPEGDPA